MYIPAEFKIEDMETITNFIKKHSFGIFITHGDVGLEATHLPFILKKDGNNLVLWGHLAKNNMQIEKSDKKGLIIFNGPDAYISPKWYNGKEAVPTWDYMTTHLKGSIRPCSYKETMENLPELLKFYEQDSDIPEKLNLPFYSGMSRAIKGFYFYTEEIETAFKLGQNHSKEDQKNVVSALANQNNECIEEMINVIEKDIFK